MLQTNTEYMSDRSRVDRTVWRFLDLTIKELKSMNEKTKKNMEFITDAIVPREGFSKDRILNMPYRELACVVNSVGGNVDYDWDTHDSYSEMLLYYRMLANILLEGQKASIPIKLFLAIPLKAFYDYMADCLESSNKLDARALKNDFLELKERCTDWKEGYTIGDFLNEKCQAATKPWILLTPIKKYTEEIKKAHEDIGMLLVDSFSIAFPKEGYLQEIHYWYEDIFAEEDYEIDESYFINENT